VLAAPVVTEQAAIQTLVTKLAVEMPLAELAELPEMVEPNQPTPMLTVVP
jgi:hypothetical protein